METVLLSVLRAALGAHVPSRVIDVLAQLIPAAIEVVRDLRRLAATGARCLRTGRLSARRRFGFAPVERLATFDRSAIRR